MGFRQIMLAAVVFSAASALTFAYLRSNKGRSATNEVGVSRTTAAEHQIGKPTDNSRSLTADLPNTSPNHIQQQPSRDAKASEAPEVSVANGNLPISLPTVQQDTDLSEYSSTNQGFVGSSACTECHQGLSDTYKKHPMYWGSTRLVSEDRDLPPSTTLPIHGKRRVLSVVVSDSNLVHNEAMFDNQGQKLYEDSISMKYVVGSGRRGKAYILEQEGVLCLSPLNWFARDRHWGLNPGYSADDPRRFDRRANTICLGCHSGKVNPAQHGSEFLKEQPFDEMEIGCEKCHGPGAQHISFHKNRAELDGNHDPQADPIVNPQNLDRFRQDSVCYQCHLQPASARILRPGQSHLDFRPGMRVDDVWVVMNSGSTVDAEGRTESVRQVQQMTESLCYVKSPKMSCTSCHDPHQVPEEDQRVPYFRDRCLACHQDSSQCLGGSEDRLAVQDSCMDCHMPKLDLVLSAHAAQTDHRILRSKNAEPTKRVTTGVFAFEETEQLPELEKRRAIAITQVRKGPASKSLVEELQYLRTQFPKDGFLALALGAASVSRRDYATALESLQLAANSPETEELALEMLTQVTYFAQDWPNAFSAFDKSLKLTPYRSQTHAIRADALMRIGQGQQAIDAAKEALKHNPSLLEVHQWLSDAHQRLGNLEEAQAERVLVERMKSARPPSDRSQ